VITLEEMDFLRRISVLNTTGSAPRVYMSS